MSLNGLDGGLIKEAHEAAAAEPGGWFLLKYASRDEVAVLSRGNGGIVEMRNNIAQFEENSPLFGFLRYRRRNVIIKYLPEGTSRLIQARVTVHFNAVCERFAPYNTTFSISTAKELKDTKLSAACSLHAASGSISSSTSSLRRRRLMEIAEEEEEEQRASKRQSVVHEDDTGLNEDDPSDASTTPKTPAPVPPVTLNADLASSPEEREFSPSSEPPDFVGAARPTLPTDDSERRMSTQTARPDLYGYSSYPYGKPKVKLGPRPSLDVSGRPKTAGTFRPVSQMPAGFKSRSYSKDGKRKKMTDNNEHDLVEHEGELAEVATAASIPLPETSPTLNHELMRPPTSSGRPATSSGVSMKSPVLSTFSTSVKQTMTPEKARLMKAMQMREKRKQMTLQPTAVPVPDSPVEEIPHAVDEATADETPTTPERAEHQLSTVVLEPGLAGDASAISTQTDPSESTRSDSRPTSPLVTSSEPEQSTKASSLSESTDETVRESQAGKDADEADSIHLGGAADEDVDNPSSEVAVVPAEDAVVTVTADIATAPIEMTPMPSAHSRPAEEQSTPERSHAKEGSEDASIERDSETPLTPPISKFSSHVAAPLARLTSSGESEAPPKTPTSPQSPSLAIPTSRFSSREHSSPRSPAPEVPTIVPPSDDVPPAHSLSTKPKADVEATSGRKRHSKRKTIEPIRTDLDTPEVQSEVHLSDDESLMNELQSATVEQAQPMSVSKSPITPVFPSPQRHATIAGNASSTKGSPRSVVRTTSNPVRGNLLTPTDVSQSSARSFSSGAAYLHKITQQQSGNQHLAPKTGKMGSKISQRIKALEQLSGSSANSEASSRVNAPSAQFFSVRKNSTREPSRSPSVVDRATSLTRQQRGSPPSTAVSESRDASPEMRVRRERSTSVASRLSMFEGPIIPSPDSMPRGRPESVSVTARIVRDPSQATASLEPPKDPAEFNRLDFKISPLEVNHQRAELVSASIPRETIQERRASREKRMSQAQDDDEDATPRRSSLSIVKDFIKERRKSLSTATSDVLTSGSTPLSPGRSPSSRPPSTHHNSGFPRRLSISSRRSSISKDAAAGAMSPSMFTETSGSGDESKSMSSDKKKSRAGRFMRRLSSSLSASRGKVLSPTMISPTVQEETLADTMAARGVTRESSLQQSSVLAYMGDVNVQFPDNLLWKRRTLCLDSQGFLLLSATTAPSMHKGKTGGVGVKRYHLSDFRNPYTPDVEIEELPNSVVLDFVDGSSLQIACEGRAGQLSVLHTLQEAHQTHAAFGQ
ncbi:hypothetical protein VD0002_g4670 [Verticillium dahliae]|uniref:ADF-H domain-containing protein n=1 Tax=Verticillium dahliae (strain VdLs.17 / ATCC MYA-4575 / FGSC 10137) TaxID=498257 RepID=G2XI48_VERDV|nr:uncharacterized protein VDAG_09698 [Verticillium dahliae VdLs.17]EGY19496.1 hypothetical protein VDAG_09698 [Verticillium dahliae VdLs.17]KAF3351799.1 Sulfite oxidase [Verticillium dahliae VDG2]PNH46751.1 hypothetical protein VD0003_g8966 [Verticillium dahliae]PNH63795.1 hypothetical protein VD0002_g4670 [Verticillium dahliae]